MADEMDEVADCSIRIFVTKPVFSKILAKIEMHPTYPADFELAGIWPILYLCRSANRLMT